MLAILITLFRGDSLWIIIRHLLLRDDHGFIQLNKR